MHKADNLPPYCAIVTKSGSLNFSEPSGPVQACYRTALPFTIILLSSKENMIIQFGIKKAHKSQHIKILIITQQYSGTYQNAKPDREITLNLN